MTDSSKTRCKSHISRILAASPSKISRFQKHIALFYRNNRRVFPWRENISPYRIVVSEVMLQQTGVERVIGKFEPFIGKFPDFSTLAGATLTEVMRAWQGLGYNRRALSLKKLAEIVVKKHSGILPDDEASLRALPGVGRATAGAIMAFAFNVPSVFVETNIRRVFIHHFFPDEEKVMDNAILSLVETAVDRKNPREWYYALMDYGTFLSSVPVNPNRKSVHYSKQSRFQDSVRQIRGKVIRSLLDGTGASIDSLARSTGCTRDRLIPILDSLVRDGLILYDGLSYQIV